MKPRKTVSRGKNKIKVFFLIWAIKNCCWELISLKPAVTRESVLHPFCTCPRIVPPGHYPHTSPQGQTSAPHLFVDALGSPQILPFLSYGSCHISWLLGAPATLCFIIFSDSSPLASLSWGPLWLHWARRISWDKFPISRSLSLSTRAKSLCHVG